jgi:hypothetical protein
MVELIHKRFKLWLMWRNNDIEDAESIARMKVRVKRGAEATLTPTLSHWGEGGRVAPGEGMIRHA